MVNFHRKSVLLLSLFSCIKVLDSSYHASRYARKFECPNYETVYIMGETGTGKSTLANYMIGKSLLDDDPNQCFKSGASRNSVTRKVKSCGNLSFPLFGNDSLPLIQMIDTPGLGDMTVVNEKNNKTLTTEEADLETLKLMAEHFNRQDCVTGIIVLKRDFENCWC